MPRLGVASSLQVRTLLRWVVMSEKGTPEGHDTPDRARQETYESADDAGQGDGQRSRLGRRAVLGAGGLLVVGGVLYACTRDDGDGTPQVADLDDVAGDQGEGDDGSGDGGTAEAGSGPLFAPGDPAASATTLAGLLFTASPAAVILAPGVTGDQAEPAVTAAVEAGVPCLVDGDGIAEELDRLGVERVRLVGGSGGSSSSGTDSSSDSETSTGSETGAGGDASASGSATSGGAEHRWSQAVRDREQVESLPAVQRDDPPRLIVTCADPEQHVAALATLRAALGEHEDTEVVTADDPRAQPVVEALRSDDPPRLVVVGDSRVPAEQLEGAVTMAREAPTVPGGGVLPLGGDRRMIALYGHPGVAGLGLLGEQDIEPAIERVEGYLKEYREVSDHTFLPAFEIIATIADSGPGPDGDYSSESDLPFLRPWIDAAAEAGVYVLLDLQPGRADFLSQAERYAELLKEPHVGLALDPEWRLEPGQRPLQQIGHVEVDEVNEVATWLAELTREAGLPQKIFMLHQFQLQMLRDRDQLRTDLPEIVTVIHADGHGTPDLKQGTWDAVKTDLPEGVLLGWKNFIDEDTPTFTPEQTMTDVQPAPRFVSYQ